MWIISALWCHLALISWGHLESLWFGCYSKFLKITIWLNKLSHWKSEQWAKLLFCVHRFDYTMDFENTETKIPIPKLYQMLFINPWLSLGYNLFYESFNAIYKSLYTIPLKANSCFCPSIFNALFKKWQPVPDIIQKIIFDCWHILSTPFQDHLQTPFLYLLIVNIHITFRADKTGLIVPNTSTNMQRPKCCEFFLAPDGDCSII